MKVVILVLVVILIKKNYTFPTTEKVAITTQSSNTETSIQNESSTNTESYVTIKETSTLPITTENSIQITTGLKEITSNKYETSTIDKSATISNSIDSSEQSTIANNVQVTSDSNLGTTATSTNKTETSTNHLITESNNRETGSTEMFTTVTEMNQNSTTVSRTTESAIIPDATTLNNIESTQSTDSSVTVKNASENITEDIHSTTTIPIEISSLSEGSVKKTEETTPTNQLKETTTIETILTTTKLETSTVNYSETTELINEQNKTTTESIETNIISEEFYDNWDYMKAEKNPIPILKIIGGNHRMPPNFNDTIRMILEMHQQNHTLTRNNSTQSSSFIFAGMRCAPSCVSTMSLLKIYTKSNKSDSFIKKGVRTACLSFKMLDAKGCDSFADLYFPHVIYISRHSNLSAAEFCSFLSGENCGVDYDINHKWKLPIPSSSKNEIHPVWEKPIENAPTFKVLHLSDTHYDPDYQEGSKAICSLPLCCQVQNGPASSKEEAAGKWGDYRKCDLPRRTFVNMLQHINRTHSDIDYILWTGDTTPHDIWNQTNEDNLNILNDTFRMIYEYFPNTPIFPAVGNHEAAPVNNFPPPFIKDSKYSISWLYDDLAALWSHWLPATTVNTIKHGAFYSVLLRKGFRIISLNTNYCNNQNIWLALNSTDAANELQWLINELITAESKEEKVHIIGHIPPGGEDCMSIWFDNYREIMKRFQRTITAQFYAHTHADEFKLFYDDGKPLSVAFLGPSATPFYNYNPGYRLYYVDGDHEQTTRTVIDYETWMMSLEEANLKDRPHWFKLYSAKLAYGMESLLPEDWHLLLQRLQNNDEMFDLFYKFYYRASPARPDYTKDNTKKKILCELQGLRLHLNQTVCS